jgi:two-component system nitrogen regulation response regulator NtrX
MLIEHFLECICNEYSMPLKKIQPKAVEALKQYNWTGNIRELRNVIERLVILCEQTITENCINTCVIK